ncbi:MAG: CoA transferase [Deltaproteobacteria bacterium]|nr:CoA transferase [Deltaproteobacteria bacterium]
MDLSQFLAGPFCAQILADIGAEIIKIEPQSGDPTRVLPPYFYKGEGAYFLAINHSKRSVILDLAVQDGRDVFYDLVRQTDVVVEAYRPGVSKKLGVDYETLKTVNSRIVYCSISGFGQDGPYATRPAYDMIVQALSGAMSLTGEIGGRPVRSGTPIGDLCAGQFAATAILAALLERSRSGMGQFIDTAMLDVQVAMLTYLAQYYLISGDVPGLQGRGHMSIPTYNAFRARDGRDVLICANTERMWQQLCQALDAPELANDPRFETNERRHANRSELLPILERAFADHESNDLLERFHARSIPSARVNSVAEALADPQVMHRRMVRDVEHTLGGTIRVLGSPIKFSRSQEADLISPPTLGQHTDLILRDLLGYSSERIEELRQRGAFGSDAVDKSEAVKKQSI